MPWPGSWLRIFWRWTAGSRISCLRRNLDPPRQLEETFLRKEKHQDYSGAQAARSRRLATERRRDQTPEALFELFRDWQRTQTQSSVRTLRSLRQQMDVRSCRDAGTTSREAHMRMEDPDPMQLRLAQTKVKVANACCACVSAMPSMASLRLRRSTPGSL